MSRRSDGDHARAVRADPVQELLEWVRILAERLRELRQRLAAGDVAAWPEYRDAAPALASVLVQLAAERRGARLTTRDMAKDYNIAPKTLLRRVERGEIQPAVHRGKFIRWKGTELLSPGRGVARRPGRR